VQSAELYLTDRAGLLEPAEALLDRPAPAQADGVAGVPRRSPVQVRAALLVVLGDMHGDVELTRGLDEKVAGDGVDVEHLV